MTVDVVPGQNQVSTPEEVDRIWRLSLGTALGPFRMMDRIGLDIALAVEEHYATIRDGIPTAPREAKTEVALRDRLLVSPHPRLAEFTAARTASHGQRFHAVPRWRSTPSAA